MIWILVYIKYQMWKIRAQCRWDHYASDRHYFGAEALHVKKYELNDDRIFMSAVNIILELMYYLKLSVVEITMPVIDTILELRQRGFSWTT